jgi:MFS family permease
MLSKRETIKGLRRFMYTGASWGGYSQIAVVTGPIFTGYALWLGLDKASIAILASVSALAGMIQPFSLLLTTRVRQRRRLIVGIGFVEIGLTMSVGAIPMLVPSGLRMTALVAAILLGTTMGHVVSPLFSGWFATVIPEDIRARYLSRQMTVVYIASIAVGYGAGRFLDTVGGYHAFSVLFSAGFVMGVAGYLVLTRIPFPQEMEKRDGLGLSQVVSMPLRDHDFARFLLFNASWSFSAQLAIPFYNVFMLKTLSIPYTTVAIFNIVSMLVQIGCFRFWGGIVDRYGSKPVLQVLMVPRLMWPALWLLVTPADYMVVLPFMMVFNGLIMSGLTASVSPLLYGLVPEQEEKAAYFASSSLTNAVAAAAGSAISAILVRRLQWVSINITPSWQIGDVQTVFLISAALMVVPILLLRGVMDAKASSPGYLLGQLRGGNPFAFAYNLYLFSRSNEESKRAQAVRAMGRSRSPMAIDQLAAALGDLSPEVRSEAAKGLGETKSSDAVAPLVEALHDKESDIRPEAAEALGYLPERRAVEALLAALNDGDTRVRISAIRALAVMGGAEVQKRLFQELSGPFDRETFPALVDALSRMRDLRILLPTVQNLRAYRSPVIRLQLLNALCRTLGAENRFYKLLSQDELGRSRQIRRLLDKSRKTLSSTPLLGGEARTRALRLADQAIEHFDLEQETEMLRTVVALAECIWDGLAQGAGDSKLDFAASSHQPHAAQIATGLQAIRTFLESTQAEEIVQESQIFLVMCLAQVTRSMEDYRKSQTPGPNRTGKA